MRSIVDLTKYKLPSAIAAALSTGRHELLAMVQPLAHDEQAEVIRLLGDLILDRAEAQAALEENRRKLREATKNLRGVTALVEDLAE